MMRMEYRMSDYTKPAPLSDWMNEVPDEYRLYVELTKGIRLRVSQQSLLCLNMC